MNYFVTAAALKAASANSLTRSTYRTLTRLKSGPRPPFIDRGVWLLPALPAHTARLLELGTGWVHAYRFYLSESLTKSVQQSCCCCEGHAASRSTICWMALSAR
jgi:hypothetical protein